MAELSKPVVAKSLSPWGKAVAGAVAALIANTIVYPLDLAKTRLQVQVKSEEGTADGRSEFYSGTMDVIRKAYASGGLSKLYAGIGGTLLGTVSTNFAYFYWYSLIRGFYIKKNPGKLLTTPIELALGALAGALAQLFTIPVSVVTTRQQAEKQRDVGFFQVGREVIAQDGIRGLWRGLKASLILVINPSITYGSASRLQTLLFNGRTRQTVYENFLLGALSKSMATIATQPLIVAKVMQQSSKKNSKRKAEHFDSFVDALVFMIKAEGLRGLFKGILPQLSKGILVQGLLLAFKDQVELYLILVLRLIQRRRLALTA